MKQFIVSMMVALAVSTSVATAGETNSGWDASVTLKTLVADKYLGFGSGCMFYHKPVIQSDLFVAFKNGAYVDVWNSTAFEHFNRNFGTEQDLGIGWAGPLTKLGLNLPNWSLDIGTTLFDEPPVENIGAGDVFFNHIKLSRDCKWMTVNAMFENFLFLPHSQAHGANLLSLGASKEVTFCRDRLVLSASLSGVYDTGGTYEGKGFFLRGTAELDYKLTKKLTLIIVQVAYYAPLSVHDGRQLDQVISAGVAYKF